MFSDVLDNVKMKRPAGYAGAVPASLRFGWKDQTAYALALRQDIGEKTQVRIGVNHGESPIDPKDVNANLGSVAVVENHLAIGLSRKLSDKVTGSVSYVHAFNNKIKSSVAPHNVIELKQNIINFQISYQY